MISAATFRMLLWKEWRDHRGGIVAYFVTAPLLLAIGAAAFPKGSWIDRGELPVLAGMAGFAIAALIFGADLVPGEARRGKLAFLARLPSELGGAFIAKLAFLVAMLALFAAWTWTSGMVAVTSLLEARTMSPSAFRAFTEAGPALLAFASWIFAVSCWLPRGTLVLPATGLALTTLLAPAVLVFVLNPGMERRTGELGSVMVWLALTGVGVAAFSFIRGWRHGGAAKTRIAWSVAPALVAFAPVWAWSATRVIEYRHLDPQEASFRLHATALGAGGKYAFVSGCHVLRGHEQEPSSRKYGAPHAMIVDVETGAWREVGEPGDLFGFLGRRWEKATAEVVLLLESQYDTGALLASQFKDGFDAATGEVLNNEQWKKLLRGARGNDVVTFETYSTLLPHGRHAWASGRKVFVQSSVGEATELRCDVQERWMYPLGQGFVGESAYYYDCTREQAFRKGEAGDVVAIRAGRWLVRTRRALPTSSGAFSLWDPATGAAEPIPFELGDLVGVHPDGRLLMLQRSSEPGKPARVGSLTLLDPETGERRDLPLPSALSTTVTSSFSSWRQPLITPWGDFLLGFFERDNTKQWLARFDPRTNELVAIGPFRSFFPDALGSPDRDTVILVEDGLRLLRAYFDGRAPELLFPR